MNGGSNVVRTVFWSERLKLEAINIGALIITYTILGVPSYYHYSILAPQAQASDPQEVTEESTEESPNEGRNVNGLDFIMAYGLGFRATRVTQP